MRRAGFTLVELLVVIAIIALLVGILLPVLSGAKSMALMVRCQANFRAIGQAVNAYAADHNNVRVPYYWPVDPSIGRYGFSAITPNIKRNGVPTAAGILIADDYLVFDCITDYSREMNEDTLLDEDKFNDPAFTSSGSSYLYFYMWTYEKTAYTASFPPIGPVIARQNLDRARSASEFALFTDMNSDEGHSFTGAFAGQPWISHPREGVSNVLFLDGSAGQGDNKEIKMVTDSGMNDAVDGWFAQAHALYAGK